MKLRTLDAAVNRVNLSVDLQGSAGARIHRAVRRSGPYEEVGTTFEETYVDAVDLEPGRTYYYRAVPWVNPHALVQLGPLGKDEPVSAKVPRAPKEKSVVLTQRHQEFTVDMGGFLDESNTTTKGPRRYCSGPNLSQPPYDQAFEPNLYVIIENMGEKDVMNPWVVANGQRDWWSVETMVREIVGDRKLTETEKAMALWQFVVDEIYDSRVAAAWYDDMSDPVKVLNSYGFEGCAVNAVTSRRLADAMGLKNREVWLGGRLDGYGRACGGAHAIFEAYADGSWHFLDTDIMVFFLKRDNRTVAGSEDLARDVDLVRRTHRNQGLCGGDMAEFVYYTREFLERDFVYPRKSGGSWTNNAGVFMPAQEKFPPPHTMSVRLRPGEKLVRYWDNVGKSVVRGNRLHPDVRFSNGKLVYRPDLRRPLSLKGVEYLTNVVQERSGRRSAPPPTRVKEASEIVWKPDHPLSLRDIEYLTNVAKERSGGPPALHPERVKEVSEIVWKVESPYAIAGARVVLTCRRATPEDGLEVLLSRDGRSWRSVWWHRFDTCVELEFYLNPTLNDWREERDLGWNVGPCYAYYIKVAMWAGSGPEGVGLDAIRFDTDIQCATRSLPSLFCGRNTICYRDDNKGSRKVRVTYGWQEEDSLRPPEAPELVFPRTGADVDRLDFEFRWRKPKGRGPKVDNYHIQVSRYPDFRWPVCPTFDRYVGWTAYAGKTCWQPQFPGLLNPDETYYWRVRARNTKGVWGAWSETRAFVPHGPRHPVNLKAERRGRGQVLTWSPDPNGTPPIKYHVYGSTERGGFSVTEEGLLGTVEEPCWPLKGGRRGKGIAYRVVAVDTHDVRSAPSDYIVV